MQHILGLIQHHHLWHHLADTDLHELFLSTTIKTLALSLVGIFIPVFLYKEGYTITQVCGFYVLFYGFRLAVVDPIIARLTSRFGVKHIMAYGYFVLLASLLLLATLPTRHWPLWEIALVDAFAMGMFWIPFHVHLAKSKSSDHEGKQLSTLGILYQTAGAMGPLIGGMLATYFGLPSVLIVAAGLVILAAVPLVMRGDWLIRQEASRLRLRDYWLYRSHLRPYCAFGIEDALHAFLWPLFLAVAVFTTNAYASIGLVTTIALALAIIAVRLYGKLVDRHETYRLLRYGSIVLMLVHLVQPFVRTLGHVIAINFVRDPAHSAFDMPVFKGLVDNAEQTGERIVAYVTVALGYMHLVRMGFWALIALLSWWLDGIAALQLAFVIGAVLILPVNSRGFVKRSA